MAEERVSVPTVPLPALPVVVNRPRSSTLPLASPPPLRSSSSSPEGKQSSLNNGVILGS